MAQKRRRTSKEEHVRQLNQLHHPSPKWIERTRVTLQHSYNLRISSSRQTLLHFALRARISIFFIPRYALFPSKNLRIVVSAPQILLGFKVTMSNTPTLNEAQAVPGDANAEALTLTIVGCGRCPSPSTEFFYTQGLPLLNITDIPLY